MDLNIAGKKALVGGASKGLGLAIAPKTLQRLPQHRFQRPEELGALVAFLASAQASAITGASVAIDGGMLNGLLS